MSNDVEKFDELQSLLSNMNRQGQGDSSKTCINEVIDKICDLFKCTDNRVFPTKNRNSPCNKSDKPWFNKSCLEKRKKKFTLQIIDIVLLKIDIVLLKIDIVLHGSFVKHKENRDAMEKKHVKNLSRK